jgi:hypothetical protein
VNPLSTGRAIVATWEPHEQTVLQTIHDLRLELQVIFNKGAVMVLPTGVNKASGLVRGLEQLKLSVHNTVGIGDAENDQTFLTLCECGVAVSNALDSVKSRADRSFYFRGPQSQLNLRVQNLDVFKQIADGVDDATWEFHLRRHDISGWFRDVIKDDALASETAAVEDAHDLSPADSRARIRHAIERRYTAPA